MSDERRDDAERLEWPDVIGLSDAEQLEMILAAEGLVRTKLEGVLGAQFTGERRRLRASAGVEIDVDRDGFAAVVVEGSIVWVRGERGQYALEALLVVRREATGELAAVAVNGRIVFVRLAAFEGGGGGGDPSHTERG